MIMQSFWSIIVVFCDLQCRLPWFAGAIVIYSSSLRLLEGESKKAQNLNIFDLFLLCFAADIADDGV